MLLTLLTLLLLSPSEGLSQKKEDPPSRIYILKTAENIGWEELDETCGECIDPAYGMKILKEALEPLSKTKRGDLIAEYLQIVESKRTRLKREAENNKSVKIKPADIDRVISDYVLKIRALNK